MDLGREELSAFYRRYLMRCNKTTADGHSPGSNGVPHRASTGEEFRLSQHCRPCGNTDTSDQSASNVAETPAVWLAVDFISLERWTSF
jgi:hypothetical protein